MTAAMLAAAVVVGIAIAFAILLVCISAARSERIAEMERRHDAIWSQIDREHAANNETVYHGNDL